MRTNRLAPILALALLASAAPALAAAGDLDPTFDSDGKVTTRVSTNTFGFDYARAVLVQPDGRIIAVGESDNYIALAGYLTNGTPDPGFGSGGLVITRLTENDYFYVADAALQPDGKIVVVGQASIATNPSPDVVVARYLTNGVLDASFGTGGLVTCDLGFEENGEAVALQPDGRIVVAAYGYDFALSRSLFAALRLLTNGVPDPSFSGDGWAEAVFSGSELAHPTALAIQADGRILLAGYSSVSVTNQVALARFQTDGAPDASFGTGGLVSTSLGTTNATADGIALQPDGRIVVAGSAYQSFDGWLLVVRYQTNGTLDLSFDTDGLVLSPGVGASAIAVQPDGKILLAGYAGNDTGLFRFNTDGSPDGGFGINGQVQTSLGPAQDSAAALARQADGRIVVAGSAFVNSSFVFALARFLGDGAASTGPTLAIAPAAPGQAAIAWTPATPGFVLQETWSLTSPDWTNAPSGPTNPATVPITEAARFFRLFKP